MQMNTANRRRFVPLLLACLGLAAPAWGQTPPAPVPAAPQPPADIPWAYSGLSGPADWGKLKPEFKTCDAGTEQSPLNLRDGIKADLGGLYIDYREGLVTRTHTGKTLVIGAPDGSRLLLGRKVYQLTQVELHHPSEHKLNGKSFPLEVQFFHRAEDGSPAVTAVFIETGYENSALRPLLTNPPTPSSEARLPEPIRLDALIPDDRAYFRYMGSLTAPPCTEGVLWTVFRRPVQASQAQIDALTKLFPPNARPTQSLNRRFLLETL